MHLTHLYKQLISSVLLYFISLPQAYADAPDILVTLKPIHSLVSNLTKGITQPKLLINGFQTPHNYHMRPSDRRLIKQSDIIIYTSPSIESFMPDLVNSLHDKRVIDLSKIPGLSRLPTRALHNTGHEHSHHTEYDGHLWLSIKNAKHIIEYLHDVFIAHDPTHRNQYTENKKQTINKLNALNTKIQKQMAQVRDSAFLMFHDAFQYFEYENDLKKAFFITSTPEHKIGIRKIRRLKQHIKEQNIHCIFYEPPQIPKILYTITEGRPTRTRPLEPLGTDLAEGADLYFKLLTNISTKLYSCLKSRL